MLLITNIPSTCHYCKDKIINVKNYKYFCCNKCSKIIIEYENEKKFGKQVVIVKNIIYI
jgi:hypothetical protein